MWTTTIVMLIIMMKLLMMMTYGPTDGLTDSLTDGPTEGHTLLKRCDDALMHPKNGLQTLAFASGSCPDCVQPTAALP